MAHSFSYQTAMANPLHENSQEYSLSRREESSKNKLFACLYVQTPLVGRNNKAKIKQIIS